jgi:hypothetical protein
MLRVARLAAAALVPALAACRPPPAARAADAGPPARTSAPPQPLLPFPAGWTVSTGADGLIRAVSPAGHPVLRAEVQRGLGLPTAATLRSGFVGGLRHLRPRSELVTESPGFIALRFVLTELDGGSPELESLLSATALGEDTLLCSTLRGATREELDVVLSACRSARSGSGR